MLMGLGQTCADGTAYVTNFGCDDGSTPTCPSGYSLSTASGQYSCQSTGATPLIGTAAPSATAGAVPGNLCLMSSFPWVGMGSAAGVCEPVSAIGIATFVGVGVFVAAFIIGGKK